MRTKFLTPNYFTTTSQTLDFLRLPLPPLSTAAPPYSGDEFYGELLRSAVSTAAAISLELQELPVDDALSKFYSDVLPHIIDVDDRFDCGIVHVSEENKENIEGDKIENATGMVQFEIPELSQDAETACMSKKEDIIFLPEVQTNNDTLEMLNLVPIGQFGADIKDSVNSVETICLEYDVAQKLQIPEDVDLLPKNVHLCDTVFPLLEVDETEPADFTEFCVEDEWRSLLVTMEEHHSGFYDDVELSCQNLLVSVKIDILELISGGHTSQLPLEFCLTNLNLTVNADFLRLIQAPHTESNIGEGDPVPYLAFEEFKIFDSHSFDIFEALAVFQKAKEPKMSDQLFHSNQHFKSFDELIVSSELAIIDGAFTSMPVPVLDDENICSVEIILGGVLGDLEQLPFSTSDEIYLDWHLLGNDKCNDHIIAATEKVFGDVEDCKIKAHLEPTDCGLLVLELLLSEYSLDNPNTREDKVNMPLGGSCEGKQLVNHTPPKRLLDNDCLFKKSAAKIPKVDVDKMASSNLSDDDDCQIIENHQLPREGDRRKVASSYESVAHVNDLDFFLNPRKTAAGLKMDQTVKPQVAKIMLSGGLYKRSVASIPSSSIHLQQINIQAHSVMLSDNILILIDQLRRSYLAMIREDTQLIMTESAVNGADDMNLLRLSEHALMENLSRSLNYKSSLSYGDSNAVVFVMLCALKRMAWCLCFYGIYNLHIYLCKLFQNMTFLKPRLLSFSSLIEDANSIVNEEITKSHPSLVTIKGILQQGSFRGAKILILAQQDFWEPLKRLLSSMQIYCIEVDLRPRGYQSDPSYDFFAGGGKDHTQTVCMLVKHEQMSPSILMQKFDIIVECGGPFGVSKVSTLYREHIGSQAFHFVKIELDDVAQALCEGVNVSSGDADPTLDGLLNFGPLSELANIASAEASSGGKYGSLPVPVCQTAQEPEAVQARDSSFPDMVIVVNTENFDKEMIISRRGTYQKILSMEKRGVQVVERDLMLPIDIILDAVTCIAWYDCKNIGRKASADDEGSSSVPLCIENIATNVLTSLSFTFTACVMVFEGDNFFLGTVMESADELYAAAASLGINIQIFCSYSTELTDEIILNYIGQMKKFCEGSLPRLPETQTHAESFLTKIPSINPLSAHAIISCGCVFAEYLEWSGDCRIHALSKYNVPEESVDLLSALFKYGEREETKSGLTDCSSSVSSPPDSDRFVRKVHSADRKRKFIPSSSDAMPDFKCSEASDKCIDDRLNYLERPSGSKVSRSPKISPQKKLPDFFLDDGLFCEGARPGTVPNMDPSKAWPESSVPGNVKAPRQSDYFAKSTLPVKDVFGEQNMRSNEYSRKGSAMDILQDLNVDFGGEIIDIYGSSPFGKDFQATERAVESSPTDYEAIEDHAPRSSKVGRKLFDTSSYLNFPTVDDMNADCGIESNTQFRADNDYNGVDYNWDSQSFTPQPEMTGTGLFEKSMKNFRSSASKEKFVPSHGETPLSKAVHSTQLQHGSPWTIEFLNRIKEKRKLRQQNQPWDTSVPPQSGNRGNISKDKKRRSPSILEYYRYQGGSHDSTPRKSTPQRLQKQHGQLSSEKPSGLRPTWTPVDKRARRSLSFATSGAGGQTKLIWNDNTSCSQDSRFRN